MTEINEILNHMQSVWNAFWEEEFEIPSIMVILTTKGGIIFLNKEEQSIYYECYANEVDLMQYLVNNNIEHTVICMQDDYWKSIKEGYEAIEVEFDYDGSWIVVK